jgi:hypothetical protein
MEASIVCRSFGINILDDTRFEIRIKTSTKSLIEDVCRNLSFQEIADYYGEENLIDYIANNLSIEKLGQVLEEKSLCKKTESHSKA